MERPLLNRIVFLYHLDVGDSAYFYDTKSRNVYEGVIYCIYKDSKGLFFGLNEKNNKGSFFILKDYVFSTHQEALKKLTV